MKPSTGEIVRNCVLFGAIGLGAGYVLTGQEKEEILSKSQYTVTQETSQEQPRQERQQIGNFTPTRIHQAAHTDFRAGRTKNGKTVTVDTIVLHTTEGSTALGSETWLTSPGGLEISAHYLVWPNGDIVQMVNPGDTAWHVHKHNENSIGIEMAGRYNQPLKVGQITRTAELASHLMDQYSLGIGAIKSHKELDPERRKDPGIENMAKVLQAIKTYRSNR